MKKENLFDQHVKAYYAYHDVEICVHCHSPFARIFSKHDFFCTDDCFKLDEKKHNAQWSV